MSNVSQCDALITFQRLDTPPNNYKYLNTMAQSLKDLFSFYFIFAALARSNYCFTFKVAKPLSHHGSPCVTRLFRCMSNLMPQTVSPVIYHFPVNAKRTTAKGRRRHSEVPFRHYTSVCLCRFSDKSMDALKVNMN